MPLYSFKAISISGKTSRGLQDASCLEDLELRLQRNDLYLINARESRKSHDRRKSKASRRDLITFFFNLDHLLRSGVPLLESLSDLHDSMDAAQFRETLTGMQAYIDGGGTLSQSMAQYPQTFGKILVSLTQAGEKSGRLPDVFSHITESLKWQDEISAQTRNMMAYPILAAMAVVGITFFLMIYLVPQLTGFMRDMGQEMPPQTRLLLDTAATFSSNWPIMLASPLLAFAFSGLLLQRYPSLQYRMDKFKLHLWLVGPILHKAILARFANTFAMMYESGISILDCIANSRDITGNLVIARGLELAAQEIESGRTLSQSLHNTGIFPPLVIRMLRVGEASGQLDKALRNVSYFYDRDVRESSRRIQALLEPAMTIVLGLLLGWVMLSVLSPIYDVISRVQT